MKEIILSAKEIWKTFSTPTVTTEILRGISIDFYKDDFTVIMGPSGAGKSTLLYAISGMEQISSGSIMYKEEDITNLSEKRIAQLRAKEFGFVFQQTNLVSNLTLEENIEVAGYLAKTEKEKEIKQKTEELLTKMNVLAAKKRFPNEVSGGEAQRAAVARAVINSPMVVFADEPTGALNKQNTKEVLELLSSLHADGQSIIMVTHDVHAAAKGSRVIYLEDGQVKGEIRLQKEDSESIKEREERLMMWLETMEW
ncbi:MAG: ABC transporter ATP-binding protein [bacterium]|nr:ABC transporter ATP-binding protein [bacterium]